jgi:hypothetical protein
MSLSDDYGFALQKESFLKRLQAMLDDHPISIPAAPPPPPPDTNPGTTLSPMGYSSSGPMTRIVDKRQYKTTPSLFLILDTDGRTPVPESDAAKWRQWMSHSPLRVLKQETLKDGTRVSTVFVGVAECLWETEVAGGHADHDAHMAYMTYAAAETGHKAIVAELSRGSRAIRIREDE